MNPEYSIEKLPIEKRLNFDLYTAVSTMNKEVYDQMLI